MTDHSDERVSAGSPGPAADDDAQFESLYDVVAYVTKIQGGVLVEDPYPAFAELRAAAGVHRGSVAELLGVPQTHTQRPDTQHYSAFSFTANDVALRDNETFSSAYYEGGATRMFGRSILEMVGAEHRRYRALVAPGFLPRRRQWWIDRWIQSLVDAAVTTIVARGRAELNADLCARIPLTTITESFGLSRQEAWSFRRLYGDPAIGHDTPEGRRAAGAVTAMLERVIEDRRRSPRDDIISMLVESEYEEDGETQLLTDPEIQAFARLILAAGSGTTWRQLGMLLVALLRQPETLDALRQDRSLLPLAIEEAVRWEPTDTIFRRLVTRDVTLDGVDVPAGVVLELDLGAANRDPARWEEPDRFDIHRPRRPHLGFAGGPHTCLGRHVAVAEMTVAMDAVLDRLPGLRLAQEHEPPGSSGWNTAGRRPST